jgi:hypothetical protein
MEIEQRTTAGNKVAPVAAMYHELMRLAVWPREPHGWTYLGTVVEKLGRAMFPEWKPYSAYGLLPDVAVGTTYNNVFVDPEAQLRYASWLVRERKDDVDYIYRANRPFAYLEHGCDGRSLSDDDWSMACDMSQDEWSIGLGNQRMFREVQDRIVTEAEAGRIVVGSRPLCGGEPAPTPRSWWFTDQYGARFAQLTIDPSDPFSVEKPAPDLAHQLFVRAADLPALLTDWEGPVDTAASTAMLSSYLRLMLDVAQSMGISPAVQPKKEIIVCELQARWAAYGLPPSNNLMNAAASLLREPESQAGRAKKD